MDGAIRAKEQFKGNIREEKEEEKKTRQRICKKPYSHIQSDRYSGNDQPCGYEIGKINQTRNLKWRKEYAKKFIKKKLLKTGRRNGQTVKYTTHFAEFFHGYSD
jgi:hypothetical protein